jgi:hypothetical protein
MARGQVGPKLDHDIAGVEGKGQGLIGHRRAPF